MYTAGRSQHAGARVCASMRTRVIMRTAPSPAGFEASQQKQATEKQDPANSKAPPAADAAAPAVKDVEAGKAGARSKREPGGQGARLVPCHPCF